MRRFDSGRVAEFSAKTALPRSWPKLKLGEGKAENQNNMLPALFGEACAAPTAREGRGVGGCGLQLYVN